MTLPPVDTALLRFEPLGSEHVPALAALFERHESACYCRYWHFAGDKNEWQARLAFEPEQNRAELRDRAARPGLAGVVALAAEDVVGWMKLERASAVPKIYAQRPYRALPCFGGPREDVWTAGCFLVDQQVRRRGVARSLLRAGIELARAAGAHAIEAFPRRAEDLR
ncbi:MAG TPA: GNAT family N-acetyltransferase, partial [Polyangiaceae bacterium]